MSDREDALQEQSYTLTVQPNEWIEDADGTTYGPGTTYTHTRIIRQLWTNGSGMFGPADGIDRLVGHMVERESVTIEGREIPGPWKRCIKVPADQCRQCGGDSLTCDRPGGECHV